MFGSVFAARHDNGNGELTGRCQLHVDCKAEDHEALRVAIEAEMVHGQVSYDPGRHVPSQHGRPAWEAPPKLKIDFFTEEGFNQMVAVIERTMNCTLKGPAMKKGAWEMPQPTVFLERYGTKVHSSGDIKWLYCGMYNNTRKLNWLSRIVQAEPGFEGSTYIADAGTEAKAQDAIKEYREMIEDFLGYTVILGNDENVSDGVPVPEGCQGKKNSCTHAPADVCLSLPMRQIHEPEPLRPRARRCRTDFITAVRSNFAARYVLEEFRAMGADDGELRAEMMRLLSDADYRNTWYDWLVMCANVSLSWVQGVGPVCEHILEDGADGGLADEEAEQGADGGVDGYAELADEEDETDSE